MVAIYGNKVTLTEENVSLDSAIIISYLEKQFKGKDFISSLQG